MRGGGRPHDVSMFAFLGVRSVRHVFVCGQAGLDAQMLHQHTEVCISFGGQGSDCSVHADKPCFERVVFLVELRDLSVESGHVWSGRASWCSSDSGDR